jgi:hypothetical protein
MALHGFDDNRHVGAAFLLQGEQAVRAAVRQQVAQLFGVDRQFTGSSLWPYATAGTLPARRSLLAASLPVVSRLVTLKSCDDTVNSF